MDARQYDVQRYAGGNMSTRTQTLIAAFALLASGGTALAADQQAFFNQQRQITDGYYPQYNVVPRNVAPTSESSRAMQAWLDAERVADSNGSRPVPFASVTVSPVRPMESAQTSTPGSQAGASATTEVSTGE
jgi:hypothetical protein